MNIRLHDVCVPAGSASANGPLFDGLVLELPANRQVGVLGGAKSGKTTLLRLICGTAIPYTGMVECRVRTSWPIPLSNFITSSVSVVRNIRFLARLYGVADESFPRQIAEMVGIEAFLNVPVQKCPKFVKPRLALALGIGLEFDTYLFDGTLAAADKDFKEQAIELVTKRMAGRGFILATNSSEEVEKYCESIFVLDAGKARYFNDKSEGIEYFKTILKAEKQKRPSGKGARQLEDENEDSDGIGDIDVVGSAIMDAFE
jgi:capsular polysaccharide transport system ATP-binding protein